MKRTSIILFFLVFALLFSSCGKTIPNSQEAKEKLQALGYSVKVSLYYGEEANKLFHVDQITLLDAELDREQFIQVYFFTNEEDTLAFYREHSGALTSGVEVVKKNKYSIYRGSQQAVSDFLSEVQ